jgi:hypothetical protein
MSKETQKEEKSLSLGSSIIIASIILSLTIIFVPKTTKTEMTLSSNLIPIYPCDIYPDQYEQENGKDWCQPYINWGYSNGLAMAQRMLSEEEVLKEIDSRYTSTTSCESIVDTLYNEAIKSNSITFPTYNRKK